VEFKGARFRNPATLLRNEVQILHGFLVLFVLLFALAKNIPASAIPAPIL
jgi:hypothetical protein